MISTLPLADLHLTTVHLPKQRGDEHFLLRSVGDDPSPRHENDSAARGGQFACIVSHHERSHFGFDNRLPKQSDQSFPPFQVQSRGRLVEEKQIRLLREGPGKNGFPFLPAGKIPEESVPILRNPHVVNPAGGGRAVLRGETPAESPNSGPPKQDRVEHGNRYVRTVVVHLPHPADSGQKTVFLFS